MNDAAKAELFKKIMREEAGKLTLGELLLESAVEGGIRNSELYHRIRIKHAAIVAKAELKSKSAIGN